MNAVLSAVLIAFAAPAMAESAVDWIKTNTEFTLQFHEIAHLFMAEGGLVVTDALIADSFDSYTRIDAPAGPARFAVFHDPADDGRVSKAILVFSDADIVCGRDVATVGIDTGLAAFFDRPTLTTLNRDAAALGPEKDLYTDWFHNLIGETNVVAQMIPLPSGRTFPMFSTGWGDGGYPVATLVGAKGQIVAVYVDFMGRDAEGTWLLPQPCSGA